MKVAKISEELAEQLKGTQFAQGQFYNPIQNNGYWIISLQEAEYLDSDLWEEVDYVEPPFDPDAEV